MDLMKERIKSGDGILDCEDLGSESKHGEAQHACKVKTCGCSLCMDTS